MISGRDLVLVLVVINAMGQLLATSSVEFYILVALFEDTKKILTLHCER